MKTKFEKNFQYVPERDMEEYIPITLWQADPLGNGLLRPFLAQLPKQAKITQHEQEAEEEQEAEQIDEFDDTGEPTLAGHYLFTFMGVAMAVIGGYLYASLVPWNNFAAAVAFIGFCVCFVLAEDELGWYEKGVIKQERAIMEKERRTQEEEDAKY